MDSRELDDGASLTIKRLAVLDYRSLLNALFNPNPQPDPSVVSFALRWNGTAPGDPGAEDSGPNRFRIDGINTHAQLAWSAKVPSKNFAFKSDAASTSHETFAELVRERNGSLF